MSTKRDPEHENVYSPERFDVRASITDLLSRRRSPRAFSEPPVEPSKLLRLFEAARWSPSSANEQPWRFIVATKEDTQVYETLLSVLSEANRRWAQRAPVLILGIAQSIYSRNGKPYRHSWYDLGQSVANLTVEAEASHGGYAMTDPQYPIGKFSFDPDVMPEKRRRWIDDIAAAPAEFRNAVAHLKDAQLDTTYREGGWTVRQVVHHMADSHLHNLVRFHMALTEDQPAIMGYDPAKWGELPDAKTGPVDVSLNLLEGIHARWVLLMTSRTPVDFARTFRRPDGQVVTLDRALQTYAWHGKHHAAQIMALRERKGWK